MNLLRKNLLAIVTIEHNFPTENKIHVTIIPKLDGGGAKPAESLHVILPAALDEPLPEKLHQPLLLATLYQLQKPKPTALLPISR